MTPELALREAQTGQLRPVYLVLGEERFHADDVVAALCAASLAGGISGFNEDKFVAGEASIDGILGAATTAPMMAQRRLVLVRAVERWEPKKEAGKKASGDASPLDRLAEYAAAPVPSTVLVLVATKLNGQRRLVTAAKKGDYLVQCDPIDRRELPHWVASAARKRGHPISAEVADMVAEMCGPELASVDDALERLSLFVGAGQPIGEHDVATLITRIRPNTVWQLIDHIGARQAGRALGTLTEVLEPRDSGLKLLGAVTWSVRQLLKLDAGLRAGLDPATAAQQAGIAPFKVRHSQQTLKRISPSTLGRWVRILAETDLALKSSRRSPQAVLEAMILDLCQS
jgi:DNA polymerase III subunit delta